MYALLSAVTEDRENDAVKIEVQPEYFRINVCFRGILRSHSAMTAVGRERRFPAESSAIELL